MKDRAPAASTYLLETGRADEERLALLNRYYNPASLRFLRASGLCNARRVLEVGCGQGQMAHRMAEAVGPDGHVVGVDASAAQLAVARASSPYPERCTWVQTSAETLDQVEGPFDLVYSRFLLQHVPDPQRVLEAMHAVLAPSGLLVVEDALVEALRFVPQQPGVVAGAEQWWFRLGEQLGMSLRFPEQLPRAVRALGLTIERFESHQPVSFERDAMRMQLLGSLQIYPAVVARGIATQAEVDTMIAVQQAAMKDEDTYIELYRALQVAARKPG